MLLRRAFLTVFGCAALYAVGVGCGLTADFSNLQGGVRDSGASLDVSAPDAPLTDGAAPGDAASGFCASLKTTPKLCRDFDEGASVGSGWTQLDVYNAPDPAVDTSLFTSSPASFLSSMKVASGSPASSRVLESLPVLAPSVHAEFQMLLPSGGGPYELFAIHEVTQDGSTYGIFYKLNNGDLSLYVGTLGDDGGVLTNTYPLGPPPATWLHVEMDVEISDTASITVKHDGAVVVSETNVPTATHSRQTLFVELGFYSNAAATARVNFDDVVLDWPSL